MLIGVLQMVPGPSFPPGDGGLLSGGDSTSFRGFHTKMSASEQMFAGRNGLSSSGDRVHRKHAHHRPQRLPRFPRRWGRRSRTGGALTYGLSSGQYTKCFSSHDIQYTVRKNSIPPMKNRSDTNARFKNRSNEHIHLKKKNGQLLFVHIADDRFFKRSLSLDWFLKQNISLDRFFIGGIEVHGVRARDWGRQVHSKNGTPILRLLVLGVKIKRG